MVTCQVNTLPWAVAFVATIPITGTGTTLLSLSDDPWCVTDETRFPPPGMRRAEVSSMLVDGSLYPSSAYENRVLQLRLAVQTATTDDLATQLQLLVRQLNKPSNILAVKIKTTQTVYFRTFRVPPDDVNIITQTRSTALVNIDVLAESCALGPQEILPTATVANDPAAVSNGMYFDVTNVKGDVETPLLFSAVNGAGGDALQGNYTVLAVRRRGTPSAAPFLLQAESMSRDGDTALQANSASFSGAGQNWTRTTFVTTSMGDRLYLNPFPAAPSVDTRGTYRVFYRCRINNANDQINVRLRYGSTAPVNNDTVTVPGLTGLQHVDLGLITFPLGPDPVTVGPSGQEIAVVGMFVALQAQPISVVANQLDSDYLLFVPADDRFSICQWGFTGPSSSTERFYADARTDAIYNMEGNNLNSLVNAALVGGLPFVSPGVTNRIYLLRNVQRGFSDDITTNTTVIASYWPRYLDPVRPVST